MNPASATVAPAVPAQLVVDAKDVLRGQREVVIVHEGVRYRLRLTRRGKLLLIK